MALIKDHQTLLLVVENILKDPLDQERAQGGKGSQLKREKGRANRVTEIAGKNCDSKEEDER